MAINSRNKGAAGEREIANKCNLKQLDEHDKRHRSVHRRYVHRRM